MIGTRMREYHDRKAKERMREGGKAGGRGRPKQGGGKLPLPVPDAGRTRDRVAETVGVSDQQRGQRPGRQAPEGAFAVDAESVRELWKPRLDPVKSAPVGRPWLRGQGDRLSEISEVDVNDLSLDVCGYVSSAADPLSVQGKRHPFFSPLSARADRDERLHGWAPIVSDNHLSLATALRLFRVTRSFREQFVLGKGQT
jgi:hypothetical protein